MAVSLLCSCAEQNVASSSVSETESKSENSIIETTDSEETSKIETSGTTIDSTTTSAPETDTTSMIETATTTKVPETEATTEATVKPEGIETSTESVAEIPDTQLNEVIELDIEGVNAYSKFPSGSGLSAVATVLGYYGIEVTMEELYNAADIYADLSIVDGLTPSPWEKIVCSPATKSSVYFAPPIVNMANKYLNSIESTLIAKDVSGKSVDELLSYVANDKPVIIWATRTGKAAPDGLSWIADNGKEVLTKAKVLIYVIAGYDTENVYMLNNTGRIFYDAKSSVEEMYQSVYSQAIIIE